MTTFVTFAADNRKTAVDDTSTFDSLIQRIREGDDYAICELVAEYEPHVRRFIRRKFNQRLQSKFGASDFIQIVWVSLFRDPVKFHALNSRTELIKLLAGMASKKVLVENRKRLDTEKYDVYRESPLDDGDQVQSREPTPSAVAVLREQLSNLLDEQDEQTRSIVRLRIQGYTFVEIGEQLDIPEYTARRAIDRLIMAAT